MKRRIVGDALRRIGRREVLDPPIVPSPDAWRYRSKITLATTPAGRGAMRIGLHPYDDPRMAFDLEDCLITRAPLMELWAAMRGHRELLPSPIQVVVLREDGGGGLHVVATGGTEPWDAGPLARTVGRTGVSYWWRAAVTREPRLVGGDAPTFPPLVFEQANADFGARIRGDAVDALGPVDGRVVWDLYSGVGDTARLLAARGAVVWSVDADRAAVQWAEARGGGVRYLAGRVEDVLSRLPEPHLVIVNPPRTGLGPRVAQRLERWATRGRGTAGRLCYVSCDPATLARDLQRMPGLRITRLDAFDLFPQTSHVETLAVLEAA